MSERVFLLSLWIRLWHWTNAGLILCLAASGISLHFSAPQAALIPFYWARDMHNICGVMLCGAYAIFFIGNILTGNVWQFVPRGEDFIERCLSQARYYLYGIFAGEPHPFPPSPDSNFNPLQQIFYWAIMYLCMPALLVTGMVYLWPALAPDKIMGVDGLLPVALAHYLFAFIIFLFLLMHVYLGTTGAKATSMFKMMITGWHEH